MRPTIKAPFVYFGGKAMVADDVWSAFGDVSHFLEPFFGSGAVLLARPSHHARRAETVCDKDGFITNAWRSLQLAPDEVARWCDWPVNHADLNARRKVLLREEGEMLSKLCADPEWFNAKLAGYWIWAASCWIGAGLTRPNARPHLSGSGTGVHSVTPTASSPTLDVRDPYKPDMWQWFRRLSERLRGVRVVCGDWTRICGGNWQDNLGVCGVFLDPPYAVADRHQDIYHHDNTTTLAHDVRDWAIERGKLETHRIVLAGYEEHDELAGHGWRVKRWSAIGGYSNLAKDGATNNRHRETLWFSPHCIEVQPDLFGMGTTRE